MQERSQRTGDAVHEIILTYSGMVYRLAYARTGNRADAEDVYQEVFFKFFLTNPPIQGEEHLKAWLIRATIHTSVNLLRSAWRRRFQPMPDRYDAPQPDGAGPEENQSVRDALCRLPRSQRVALHLYYYEQLSAEEIARILGEKSSTVRSRIKRGREKLKSLLLQTEVK